MAPPRASILLPVHDAADTLPACLRSIARQRFVDFECVLVDDGSRDASLDVARAFAAGDARFRVHAQPHAGLVAALRRGLGACRGDVVVRMDADDLMHRERLAAQVAALDADPSLSAVGCRVRLFPRRGLSDGMRAYERWLASIATAEDVRREAFIECPVAHPGLTLRTRVLRELGYRDRGWPEDYDLVLRLLARGERIEVLPERLLSWRQGDERLSRTHPTYAVERFTACKAAFLCEGFLAAARGYVLWGYGSTGRSLRRALAEHGRHPSAIVEVHPRRLGNRIHGAPVIGPEALVSRPREPLVVSVAGAGPRGLIREELTRLGFRETVDYVCAA